MKTAKLHVGHRTFHQLYRAWVRERVRVERQDVRNWEVERYGARNVALFHRFDGYVHRLISCTIHVRTNYRAAAVKELGERWPNECLALHKMWRGWAKELFRGETEPQ